MGTPYMFTSGFGPSKNKTLAGVYHFFVYMQLLKNTAVCIYTKEWYTPAIFWLGPNPVVVYI